MGELVYPRSPDGRYYDERETWPRETMRAYQLERLKVQIAHAYANSVFYRRKFDEHHVTPDDLQTLDDLRKFPFTTKEELKRDQHEHPLYGTVTAVPPEKCLRLHFTSGTTGRPVHVLDTREDFEGFVRSYARGLYGMGIRPEDVVVCAFGYGPWIGFWSGFYAAQDVGCLVIPVGGLSTEQRLDILETYGVTVLGCTPSYALHLAETARRLGRDLSRLKIRITWHTGEPGAAIPSTRDQIREAFGARVCDLPGLTEIAAWGFSCEAESGLDHVHEDYVYPEVLDPETDRPVGPGEVGELVFTSLYRQALPLVRYRTRDMVRVADRACPCGRTLFSIEGGVIGRLDDMKKIRGVIVYPTQIEEVVRRFSEVQEFQIRIWRRDHLDEVTVRVDTGRALGEVREGELTGRLEEELRRALGIRVGVEVAEPGSLPRFDHKARRLVDERSEVPF
jgi:phenylacetate-CoA ligase